MQEKLHELVDISLNIGASAAMVQGGGGNTSVKLDNELMAIKASGFELRELTSNTGFSIVNYKNIRSFFSLSNPNKNVKYNDFIQEQKIKTVDNLNLRPSMETGFHALLSTYVIHSHSVFSNLINCCKEGKELITKIFSDFQDCNFIWIPYSDPGYPVSEIIFDKSKNLNVETEDLVLFLQNHGLIISSSKLTKVIQLHESVNKKIKQALNISDTYPQIILAPIEEGHIYKSASPYIQEIGMNYCNELMQKVLFPDQVVYFSNKIGFDPSSKIFIDFENCEIVYKANLKEARTYEETLVAYVYIFESLKKNNLTPNFINFENVENINNMESEKYRKEVMES